MKLNDKQFLTDEKYMADSTVRTMWLWLISIVLQGR